MSTLNTIKALLPLLAWAAIMQAQGALAQAPAGPRTPSPSTAREAAPPADTAMRDARETSAFCANCHGADGNSLFPEVPNLAGQNPAYLLEQIRKFGTGERKNEFMQQMIRVLSDKDMRAIAQFYAQQTVKPRTGGDPAQIEKGRQWFTKLCFRCHGNDGRGNEKIARIAGQQAGYVELTLKRYRSGSGERIDAQMAANTSVLTDADIRALALYLSHQP